MVRQFIKTLAQVEKSETESGLIDRIGKMVEIFDEEAELSSPAVSHTLYGKAGAWQFWRDYSHAFHLVRTHYHHVYATDSVVILEWVKDGDLVSGRSFHLPGVTIVELDRNKVTKLRVYFDSAILSPGQPGEQGPLAA